MEFLNAFGMSMLPVTGIGENLAMGNALGMSAWESCAAVVVGNFFPVPFFLTVLNELLDFLKQSAGRSLRMESEKGEWIILILTVVPLPVAGAWMGTAAAAVFGMSFGKSLTVILMGLVISVLMNMVVL